MKTTDKPALQDFHIEGVKHITPSLAFEALKNNEAVLIDVREEDEVSLERIPLDNVLYHPLSVILDRIPYISKDQQIILGCSAGVRSVKVANLLNIEGFTNVANLDGGFATWKTMGLPIESVLSLGGNCGCGCNPSPTGSKGGSCC